MAIPLPQVHRQYLQAQIHARLIAWPSSLRRGLQVLRGTESLIEIVRRMALLGEIFTADEGLHLGLVDQVVASGASLQAARDMAARIAARGPAATQATKMLINAAEGEELERPLEALAGSVAAGSADLKEGVAAFRDKRKPKF